MRSGFSITCDNTEGRDRLEMNLLFENHAQFFSSTSNTPLARTICLPFFKDGCIAYCCLRSNILTAPPDVGDVICFTSVCYIGPFLRSLQRRLKLRSWLKGPCFIGRSRDPGFGFVSELDWRDAGKCGKAMRTFTYWHS